MSTIQFDKHGQADYSRATLADLMALRERLLREYMAPGLSPDNKARLMQQINEVDGAAKGAQKREKIDSIEEQARAEAASSPLGYGTPERPDSTNNTNAYIANRAAADGDQTYTDDKGRVHRYVENGQSSLGGNMWTSYGTGDLNPRSTVNTNAPALSFSQTGGTGPATGGYGVGAGYGASQQAIPSLAAAPDNRLPWQKAGYASYTDQPGFISTTMAAAQNAPAATGYGTGSLRGAAAPGPSGVSAGIERAWNTAENNRIGAMTAGIAGYADNAANQERRDSFRTQTAGQQNILNRGMGGVGVADAYRLAGQRTLNQGIGSIYAQAGQQMAQAAGTRRMFPYEMPLQHYYGALELAGRTRAMAGSGGGYFG